MRIYIHWPFCVSRCSYCDFNTRVASRGSCGRTAIPCSMNCMPGRGYCRKRPGLSSPCCLGGGTPSTLRGVEVANLVGEAGGLFGIRERAEVTVEVNPATWSYDDFASAHTGGANRFSIGIQSTHDEVLRLLGRLHNSEEAKKAVRDALRCGAPSVSADLLYGLPGMDCGSLRRSLEEVLEMGVHHVSLYALTLAERAPLARMVARGEVGLPDEDEVADQYFEASAMLEDAGAPAADVQFLRTRASQPAQPRILEARGVSRYRCGSALLYGKVSF